MGTGVGEAMLLGAAVGGGSAAITGGDPLKGALLGGLTGGVGSGIGGALAGAEAGTVAGATSAGSGLTGGTLGSGLGNGLAAMEPTLGASTNFALNAPSAGLNASSSLSGLNPSLAQAGMQSGTNFALNAPSIAPGASSAYSLGAPSVAPGAGISALPNAVPSAATTAAAPAGSSFQQAMQDPTKYIMDNKLKMAAAGMVGAMGSRPDAYMPEEYNGPLKRFRINQDLYRPAMFAEGGDVSGIATLATGGYDRMVGEEPQYPQSMASGGISSLGSYSDGGRMLRGPGDGMSDSIPASISGKRPARLADGEFVVPADVVSHLGNGSTDAGAKQLYSMMDKVRSARTGRKSQGREINPRKYMPA